jgi:hypothetical protein
MLKTAEVYPLARRSGAYLVVYSAHHLASASKLPANGYRDYMKVLECVCKLEYIYSSA